MKIAKLIRSLLLVAGLSVAFVATAGDDTRKRLNELDLNGDGFIDKSEATQDTLMRERWNDIDKDDNQRVGYTEYKKFKKVPDEPLPK